jgi:hypothetical protein
VIKNNCKNNFKNNFKSNLSGRVKVAKGKVLLKQFGQSDLRQKKTQQIGRIKLIKNNLKNNSKTARMERTRRTSDEKLYPVRDHTVFLIDN